MGPRTIEIGKRVILKRGLPSHLVLFVTNRCEMSCQHCFLVENGELNNTSRRGLELEDIKKLASSVPKLLALSVTGGEPFLRKDLPEIIQAFAKSNYLKSVAIVSNGYQPSRIIPTVKRLLKENDVEIFLSISLDGESRTHNKIRGKSDGYSKAFLTLVELSKLSKSNRQLSVGVNSTYTGDNYHSIYKLYQELKCLNLDYVTLNLIRGATWDSVPDNIDISEYKDLVERKEKLLGKQTNDKAFFNSLIAAKEKLKTRIISNTIIQNTSVTQCYAGSLFGVIKDNGDIFACEQLPTSLGNLATVNYDLSQLWFSQTAEGERKAIANRECHCTYECVSSCNIFFNVNNYPALLRELFWL